MEDTFKKETFMGQSTKTFYSNQIRTVLRTLFDVYNS